MKRVRCSLLLPILVAFLAGYLWIPGTGLADTAPAHPAPGGDGAETPEDLEQLHRLADNLGRIFRHTAESVSPAVVWIEAERRVTMRQPRLRSPFEEFFGPGFEDFFGPREREREFRQQGLGSGFIIDQEGHILTNHHVVAGADRLTVKLPDGRQFDAEVSGTDEATELAVIRLSGAEDEELPVAALGDSDELYVGEWVIAIGNPLGLSYTVSSGIVSAKGRSVGLARYENLIQTDAAINPGNSGGPLVNLKGEVVGINTAIISRTGGYMGIGLAIPINMAKPILDAMIAGEEVERGYLGVYGADLTPELAESFDYATTDGALVNETLPDSPASRAGIEAGDIIMRWNGRVIENFTQLRLLVAETKPGEIAEIVVFRGGEERTFEVEVGSLREQEQPRADTWLGIEVAPVTDEVRERYDAPDLQGVLVQEVDPDGPAAERLRPGDVILRVGNDPVKDVGEFNALMEQTTPGTGVRLYIFDSRTGSRRFIPVRGR